jgi:hypothetical protein
MSSTVSEQTQADAAAIAAENQMFAQLQEQVDADVPADADVGAPDEDAPAPPTFTADDLGVDLSFLGDPGAEDDAGESGDAEEASVEESEQQEDTSDEAQADETEEQQATEEETEEAEEAAPEPDPNALTLPASDTYQPTDADQAAAAMWGQRMEALGISREQQEGLAATYAAMRAQLSTVDETHAEEGRSALIEHWGGEEAYQANRKSILAFLGDQTRVSPRLAEMIETARMPDTRRLVNDPEFLDMLLDRSRSSTQGKVDDALVRQRLLNKMNTDIDGFRNDPWDGGTETGSERMLALERRAMEITQPVRAQSAREVEINRIMVTDIDRYRRENLGDELERLTRARLGNAPRVQQRQSQYDAAEVNEIFRGMRR